MTFFHPLQTTRKGSNAAEKKNPNPLQIFLANQRETRYIPPMTPQQRPARLKWQINLTPRGFEKDTHMGTKSLNYAAYTYVCVPFSRTHGTARRADTETLPTAWHVAISKFVGTFGADEEESFHPWQYCQVRWEAEKIRREIERRHPRPFRTITFETQKPHESGTLRNCRYLVYSLD